MILCLHPEPFPTMPINLPAVPRVGETIIIKVDNRKDLVCHVNVVKYTYFPDGELEGKSVVDIFAGAQEV